MQIRSPVARPSFPAARVLAAPNVSHADEWRKLWSSVEAIQQWIGGHFLYDEQRQEEMMRGGLNPYTPDAFYESSKTNPKGSASGVCIDLALFGVEAAMIVAPSCDAKLMQINMVQLNDDGSMRHRWRHWIGVYQNAQGRFFGFADSRAQRKLYDGDGSGYASPADLFAAYQSFWNSRANRRGDITGYEYPGRMRPPRPEAS